MTDTRHLTGKEVEYIARSSHGKDSLKMLDVIVTRGLLLDRITTTDIWATDTLRGEHPLMVKHKEKVDDFIWKRYRIEVEHLCAMKNGKKVTYEKMFYHVPKRKERETPARDDIRMANALGQMVSELSQARSHRTGSKVSLHKSGAGARNSKSNIYGFPISINRTGAWCAKLKTRFWKAPPRGARKISWSISA